MNILVVDDNSDLRFIFEHTLRKQNEVDTATNGEEAINLLSAMDYNVIILDLNMPKVNGFDVLEWMGKNKKQTPVIVVTHLTLSKEQEDLLSSNENVKCIMPKGFELQHLLETI